MTGKAWGIAKALRDTFKAEARWQVMHGQRIAVALSGGVDSCAVFAAVLEEVPHDRIVVVSYTPSTHESTDFQMARANAEAVGVEFIPVPVSMTPESLDRLARYVIGMGYRSKVQVESLAPMAVVASVAGANAEHFLTGDQSDGYFALSKWAAHNWDRSQGVPVGSRDRTCKHDTDPTRIDGIRDRYYEDDLSCSGAVGEIAVDWGMEAHFFFRNPPVREAFRGSLWSEINQPRIKEPIHLGFNPLFEKYGIRVRPNQVNLHKGDSKFGDTMSEVMSDLYPGFASIRGIYAAIANGEA